MNKCTDKCSSFPHEHIDDEHLVRSYIDKINKDSETWNKRGINVPWYRGQSDAKQSPRPKIFRKEKINENIDCKIMKALQAYGKERTKKTILKG